MKDYKREPQSENWWLQKICPKMSKNGLAVPCYAKDCALWMTIRKDRDSKLNEIHIGFCTI